MINLKAKLVHKTKGRLRRNDSRIIKTLENGCYC